MLRLKVAVLAAFLVSHSNVFQYLAHSLAISISITCGSLSMPLFLVYNYERPYLLATP